ncbi:MAG: tetratricopeptide repeat protein [Ferruginibacter sp.]
MAVKKATTTPVTTTTTPETNVAIERAKGFWDKYSKPIIYVGSAIILAIAGYYIYQNYVVKPKEEKASSLVFAAENLFDKMASASFNKDSVNLVLNGGTSSNGTLVTGVLKVISNYGGTKTANRAKYIAGATYLQIKEFDKAIKYLKDFDGNGADQVQSKAYIMLGHAYAEKKNSEEALSYYKKASRVNSKDESITPYALLMAASYAEATGKNKEAIDLFKEVKEKYPANTAVTSGDVEKHLAVLAVFN